MPVLLVAVIYYSIDPRSAKLEVIPTVGENRPWKAVAANNIPRRGTVPVLHWANARPSTAFSRLGILHPGTATSIPADVNYQHFHCQLS
jgi:hypothetical protein